MTGDATIAALTLGEIRRELLALTKQADLAAGNITRNPATINGPDHPMPGPEWLIATRSQPWIIRAAASVGDADCVFVCTPGHIPGDYVAIDTAHAREVALAILAACDYADHARAGLAPTAAVDATRKGMRLLDAAARA
jgi:hypothetical protein